MLFLPDNRLGHPAALVTQFNMNERRGPLLKSDDVDHGVVPNSERHTLPGRGFPYLDLFLGDSSFFLANDDRCAGNGEPANVRLYDSLLDDRFFVIMDGGSTQPRLLGFTWTRKRKPRKRIGIWRARRT